MKPINKNYFGSTTGKLAIKFYDGFSYTTGYIIKQSGAEQYVVSAGSYTTTVKLAQNTNELNAVRYGSGPLANQRSNFGTILVTKFDGSIEHIRAIYAKILFTVEGSILSWGTGLTLPNSSWGNVGTIGVTHPIANIYMNKTTQ